MEGTVSEGLISGRGRYSPAWKWIMDTKVTQGKEIHEAGSWFKMENLVDGIVMRAIFRKTPSLVILVQMAVKHQSFFQTRCIKLSYTE